MNKKPNLDDLPEVLTPPEAARVLRVGRNGIYEAIHRGEVPSFRIGRKVLIPKAGLIRMLTGPDSTHTDAPSTETRGAPAQDRRVGRSRDGV